MRALLYGRVSHDPTGQGRTVDSQLDECRRWAEREGWTVVAEIRDVDRSASRHAKRKREGWAEVVGHLSAGEVDLLVCWEASRAQRDLAQYAELRKLCESTGTRWAYSGTVYDLADRSDRFRTGLDALVAEDEAGRISERSRRGVAAAAAMGRPTGRVLFGYRRVYDDSTGALLGQEVDTERAQVVTEVVRRFLAGESLRSLTLDLNERGIPGPARAHHGGPSTWHHGQTRRILSNPAYAGHRVHRGKVIGPAAWPAIIDPDVWQRVQARLDDPGRRSRHTVNGPVNLLTGIARCGVCGSGLVSGNDRGRRTYVCRLPAHAKVRPGTHVIRDMRHLDAFVTALVLERLGREDVEIDDSPGPDVVAARAEVGGLRARLDAAAEQFVAGDLSAVMLSRVERDLTAKIAETERRTRWAGLPTTAGQLVDGDVVWDDLTVEQRRELIRAMIVVRVNRSKRARGSKGFEHQAIDVEWLR